MSVTRHRFTDTIESTLNEFYPGKGADLLNASPLLQYLNIKTKAAYRGSKSRAGLANHYAIYVLVKDYLDKGFDSRGNYQKYEGARFSDLHQQQQELPFGSKLQNHALNNRMNEEFKKHFPKEKAVPILRDLGSKRYRFNESLIVVSSGGKRFRLAKPIIKIIDRYVEARMDLFNRFIAECAKFRTIRRKNTEAVNKFMQELLRSDVDARIFEIVSYSILKQHYAEQAIHWGWSKGSVKKEFLCLYKTGRTNANDGGIDFVMKPLGKFFQVTETVDFGKYFLDIDKVQRYPITFVVKSREDVGQLREKIHSMAVAKYGARKKKIIERYMNCVEDIINVPILLRYFEDLAKRNRAKAVIDEIILQGRVEFNVEDEKLAGPPFPGGKAD